MNDLRVFLTTEVKHTGFLSAVGDFFLAPTRFFFSGKTIIVERNQETDFPKPDGYIAKVSSFYLLHEKSSKQEASLKSITWGPRAAAVFIPVLFFLIWLPSMLVGAMIKGLAYSSPFIRQAHHTVKTRLTARQMMIGRQDEWVEDNATLANLLEQHLLTGQKTSELIIYARINHVDEVCLKLIKKINPHKLILVGHWTIDNFNLIPHLHDSSSMSLDKKNTWDSRALMPQEPNHFNYPDDASNIVTSVEKAVTARGPSFFSKIKHTVYVVHDEAALPPDNAP